jgi:glycosyltransferase, group 1 family
MECPTVAFEVGGIPEIITHGVTGYLARYRDVVDLARGMEEMLRATEKGSIAQCRTDVLLRYDTSSIVQQYLNVYTSLILESYV